MAAGLADVVVAHDAPMGTGFLRQRLQQHLGRASTRTAQANGTKLTPVGPDFGLRLQLVGVAAGMSHS